MAGTQYLYADNLEWKLHPVGSVPCMIQVQYGGTALIHFGMSVNVAQVDTVTVVTAVVGNVYSVVVDGTTYSYTAPAGATLATIADGLAALIPNSVSDAISKVTITSATAGVAQVVTIGVLTTVPTDLIQVTTVANKNATTYEGVMHQHLDQGEPFRYTGNEAIWCRVANTNVSGIYQRAKVVCSPLVNV